MTHRFPPIGMSPSVWGPLVWTTMHIASIGYSPHPTDAEKTAAIEFYRSFALILPCPICRTHYSMHIKAMPIEEAVESRDTLIEWVFSVHNKVNIELGKPEISFEQYIENMSRLSQRSEFTIFSNTNNAYTIPAAVVIGGLAGIVAYHFYQSRLK